MQIHSYLTFNGNCRQAMKFYQKCLGGELTFQTIGESPLSEKLPAKMKNTILCSTLKKEKLFLIASDLVGETGLRKGNSVSLVLQCSSQNEMKILFKKLSVKGQQSYPPQLTHRGSVLAELTDKFGNRWLLYFSKKQNGRSF